MLITSLNVAIHFKSQHKYSYKYIQLLFRIAYSSDVHSPTNITVFLGSTPCMVHTIPESYTDQDLIDNFICNVWIT